MDATQRDSLFPFLQNDKHILTVVTLFLLFFIQYMFFGLTKDRDERRLRVFRLDKDDLLPYNAGSLMSRMPQKCPIAVEIHCCVRQWYANKLL